MRSVTLHFISLEQIDRLESMFAYLTVDGWRTPLWITDLRANARGSK